MPTPEPVPSLLQLQRHAKRHGDHHYDPIWRTKGADEMRVVCRTCVRDTSRRWQAEHYQPTPLPTARRTIETPADPTAAQVSNHQTRHPDHQPTWAAVGNRWRCATCARQQKRQPIRARAIKATPTLVRAATPNGLTVGQLLDALQLHHPDDRVEVSTDTRRRQHGRRIACAVIIPSPARTHPEEN